jgi:hypothetical protein
VKLITLPLLTALLLAPLAALHAADAPKPTVKVTQELLNSIHVTPKLIFDPFPAYAQKYLPFAMAASMEVTHKGRLWLFFHQSVGMFDGSCSNWYVRCDDPDAEKPAWTEPVYIGFGASLNKPIVRKNGEWILPVSLWERWHIDKPFADCYVHYDRNRYGDAEILFARFREEDVKVGKLVSEGAALKNIVKSRLLGMNRGGADAATSLRESKQLPAQD